MSNTCTWACGDTTPFHGHFAILIREDGHLLGRLCPDGTTARKAIHAAVLSRKTADTVAGHINDAGEFTAKVVPF